MTLWTVVGVDILNYAVSHVLCVSDIAWWDGISRAGTSPDCCHSDSNNPFGGVMDTIVWLLFGGL